MNERPQIRLTPSGVIVCDGVAVASMHDASANTIIKVYQEKFIRFLEQHSDDISPLMVREK